MEKTPWSLRQVTVNICEYLKIHHKAKYQCFPEEQEASSKATNARKAGGKNNNWAVGRGGWKTRWLSEKQVGSLWLTA